jgi:YfiH family protein
MRQVHGASVAEAGPGVCGEADALLMTAPGLAGCVATADCLAVALTGEQSGAIVHAGWRGLAAGILRQSVDSVGEPRRRLSAWIGPSVGPCCYEVGEDVAESVAGATGSKSCRIERPGGRPHLDLRRAATDQLAGLGVERISVLDHCTRCRSEWLWSHRRDGDRAGRNWALLWRAA